MSYCIILLLLLFLFWVYFAASHYNKIRAYSRDSILVHFYEIWENMIEIGQKQENTQINKELLLCFIYVAITCIKDLKSTVNNSTLIGDFFNTLFGMIIPLRSSWMTCQREQLILEI